MEKKWRWTSGEVKFLSTNFQLFTCKELAKKLERTEAAVKRRARDLKLVKDESSLKKIYARPNAGQFRKGASPLNTKFDQCITTRLDRDGRKYQWIRLSEGNWQLLHIYNWLKAGKKYDPKNGDILRFDDGNTMNADPLNLRLITRTVNMELNRKRRLSISEKKKKDHEKQKEIRKKKTAFEREKARIAAEDRKQLSAQRRLEKQERKRKLEREKMELKKLKGLREAIRFTNKRKLQNTKLYEPKQIDLSQLILVRIDSKTCIYIRPGQDPEQEKEKYWSRLQNSRSRMVASNRNYHEVKKFKADS